MSVPPQDATLASQVGQRNYPMNCWWVAARGDEVGRTPLGRWYLDRPVVLYRTEAGRVVALDDRCMHRSAPLSTGFLEGDELVCGYHGARFAPDGRCSRFPTQPTVPPAACVRSYPVQEHGPFIWIWLGDAALAGTTAPPALDWATDPGWTLMQGGMLLDANYMLLHENVLDLTHFNTLHRHSFGITRWEPPTYRIEGDEVVSWQVYDGERLTPQERAALRWDEHMTGMSLDARFVTPALHLARGERRRRPGGPLQALEHTTVAHLLTPASPRQTHYWWLRGVGARLPTAAQAAAQHAIETGFQEDKVMLSAIQSLLERDARGSQYPEVSFVGDSGGLMARRVLQRLLARERRHVGADAGTHASTPAGTPTAP